MSRIVKVTIDDCDHWFTKLTAFPRNHSFSIDPKITWVVGENGAGKSSLLAFINEAKKLIGHSAPLNISIDGEGGVMFFFDTERMNPRIKGRVETMLEITILMSRGSHGQIMMPVVTASTREAQFKGGVVLIDEPEAGVSPWNQKKMLEAFTEASEHTQFIMATHSPYLIESGVGSVLDLTDGPAHLVPSTEFKLFR